ncbi:hypothetical protein PHLGIDRAFT_72901 [Phlebiopsis gigantea 11061_1 CR5-6]|uniref:non-specific serine/threonine protein kinase n=1 Tax=Phlebiopsis gigantea (strain 11061_1 CR5-6) TaxID=745531 RepID=A0A0C3PJI1_PHLG1|nr:hypothetical protein PHLGIDRAFT_72901 [Phlebiopsis gigantea 11061_1 CR5-6]
MPDFSGRVVKNGQYQLVKLLGSGSYGVVYGTLDLHMRAQSSLSKTSSRLAIKVLRKADLSSSAAQRVRREVAAHRQMSDHPNVVRMHEAFEDKDFVYIVLDYCPGGDLFGKIVDEKLYFMKDEIAKSVFLQLLGAVEACHRRGVYHRDLKSENVLTSKDGTEVFLTDFGLATGTKTSHTFGCGSSCYMSPECIGRETAFRTYSNAPNDVWALGIILLNMITSRSPWAKASTNDACFSEFLLNEDYLREMLPISEGANAIFRQIFRWDPRERITIPALRTAILELDTFFMSTEELARASEPARMVAEYGGVVVQPIGAAAAKAERRGRAPAKVAVPPPPRTPAVQVNDNLATPPTTSAHQFVGGDLSEDSERSSASDSSSSSAASSGPVTPSTIAQDLELEVTELDITDASHSRSRWRRMFGKSGTRNFRFISAKVVA